MTHRMYGWRDVARYVADEVQPALVACVDSLARAHERDAALALRIGQLEKAHNAVISEISARLINLEQRVETLERLT